MEGIKKNLEERSKKTISVLKEDLNTVRAGRANPALLDKVMVEYYGTPTPLKNLSNISVPDPRTDDAGKRICNRFFQLTAGKVFFTVIFYTNTIG